MRVAVTGAAGDQGAAIAGAFVDAGYETLGLTRDNARANAAARSGATATVVDEGDADALAATLTGCDALVFTSPAAYRDGAREAMAGRYAAAAKRAGVRRVVINTAAPVVAASGPNGLMLEAVIAAFAALPEHVVLEPTVYMDNLAAPWVAAGALRNGALTWAQPTDARVSWISHRTLAAFALAAATRADAANTRHRIGGPTPLTGADLARALGDALGRTLGYAALPLDAFAANLDASFGPPSGARIAETYRWMEHHRDAFAVPPDAATALGVTAEPLAAWAARQHWPEQAAA